MCRRQSLAKVPGKETIGIDGHKDGKRRHVETVTRMKLGISALDLKMRITWALKDLPERTSPK